ncbi:MAG TPA: hypothetical protein GXX14_03675 [Clostridiaceae bacterium]|nr:hypothetical protein [Clostridiaceae bacterium]
MTQLELFRATVEHRPHDEILFYASFTPAIDEKLRKTLKLADDVDLRDYFGMYNPVEVKMDPPEGYTPPDFSKYYKDIEIPENAFINELGVLEIPGSSYHFTRYVSPLRDAESIKDIEDFEYPNVDNFTDNHMKEKVEKIHAKGKVACFYLTHMYEDSWQIRGYEQFLMDMIENPEMCEFILDRICERNLKKAEAAARAGVDVLMTGDDVANQRALMFSQSLWRKFIKPRWEKVYKRAKEINKDIKIWYHSDGNIESIIPELVEIGVDILNPIQPECLDPVKVKSAVGDRIVLDGTIGTQTVMPFGTPEDVKTTVKEMRSKLGYDGALILSPTHVLEPEVPVDNILAFIEACKMPG